MELSLDVKLLIETSFWDTKRVLSVSTDTSSA